jgi:iron complex transport system substrate-binding protein
VTDTLLAIGAAESLVAVSDYCDAPRLPRVGSAVTPAFERIAAERPTLIVWSSLGGAQTAELGRLAPSLALPWLSLAEIAASTRALGARVGRPTEASALAARLERELGQSAPADAPRVLLLMGSAEIGGADVWYIRPGSLHGQLLAASGYRNAVWPDPPGPPRLTVERVLELAPDAIIVLRDGVSDHAAEAASLERLAKLTPLEAVRRGRLGALSLVGALSMGPRVLDVLPALRACLAALFEERAP